MSQPGGEGYTAALGHRLREIRLQQGLSLQGVEKKSAGKWKGVVIGSYERGSRAISVQRLSELASFYRVAVAELLPAGSGTAVSVESTPRLTLDLDALQELPASQAAPLARYIATLQAQRGDESSNVTSIRRDDLWSLAIIYDETPASLLERMASWGVLITRRPREIDLRSLEQPTARRLAPRD